MAKTDLEKQYDNYKAMTRYHAKKYHCGGVHYKTLEEFAEARTFFSNKAQALGSLRPIEQREFFGNALTDVLMDIDVDSGTKEEREDNQREVDTINKLLNKELWFNKDYEKFHEIMKKHGIGLKIYDAE